MYLAKLFIKIFNSDFQNTNHLKLPTSYFD